MTKKLISEHKEKLSLFRQLVSDRGENHPFAKVFNHYANRLEAQIKQAEEDKLTCFDESKYKVRGEDTVNKHGWYEK
jgi:hypothetical protein